MTKTFMMKLDEIQPSQLYISSEKLSEVNKTFDPDKPESIEPVQEKPFKSMAALDCWNDILVDRVMPPALNVRFVVLFRFSENGFLHI